MLLREVQTLKELGHIDMKVILASERNEEADALRSNENSEWKRDGKSYR